MKSEVAFFAREEKIFVSRFQRNRKFMENIKYSLLTSSVFKRFVGLVEKKLRFFF